MNSLGLTALVTFSAVAIVYAAARLAAGHTRNIFLRGAGPMLVALGAAFGLVLPAFVLFEPPHTGESHGLVLVVLAAAGASLVALWFTRASVMLAVSHRITSAWKRHGLALDDGRWGMRATVIDAGFPVVAVAGIVRPRLFIDRRVVDACLPGELDAIAAHERAHVLHRDNLRRLALGAAAGARSPLATLWREAAEHDADREAATSPRVAVDLAAALLKLSRLAPPRSLELAMLSTIHDGGLIEARVRRLLAHDVSFGAARPSSRLRWWLFLIPVVIAAPALLESIHAAFELIVRDLP